MQFNVAIDITKLLSQSITTTSVDSPKVYNSNMKNSHSFVSIVVSWLRGKSLSQNRGVVHEIEQRMKG